MPERLFKTALYELLPMTDGSPTPGEPLVWAWSEQSSRTFGSLNETVEVDYGREIDQWIKLQGYNENAVIPGNPVVAPSGTDA